MTFGKMIEKIQEKSKEMLVVYNGKKLLVGSYRFSCEDGEFSVCKMKNGQDTEIFRSDDENVACCRFMDEVLA